MTIKYGQCLQIDNYFFLIYLVLVPCDARDNLSTDAASSVPLRTSLSQAVTLQQRSSWFSRATSLVSPLARELAPFRRPSI
jgi:hypothetical protein